uniref:Uncharacterized protein n=1 Tax=Callorhinchus milii TaxID=7868 RepID=A0A4W3HZE6_CALMI
AGYPSAGHTGLASSGPAPRKGTDAQGCYPGTDAQGCYPGTDAQGCYPGTDAQGCYPGTDAQGCYPGTDAQGCYPGTDAQGCYPGTDAQGCYPGTDAQDPAHQLGARFPPSRDAHFLNHSETRVIKKKKESAHSQKLSSPGKPLGLFKGHENNNNNNNNPCI